MAELEIEIKSNRKADKFRDEGNASYHENNFFEALINYNKSLCFAETSKVKSLAYANRSAVYLETKKYQHCLDNIQLAREHGFPEPSKLEKREVKCRNLVKDHQTDPLEDPWNFFKLSYPANEKLPFMAQCLELKEDQKYGRLIATNRDLKPGDIVLIEEPWFNFLNSDHCYERCSNCMKENMLSLIPCTGRCVNTMFCSEECAKSRSFRHRQFECPMSETISQKLYFDSANIVGVDLLLDYIAINEKLTIFDIDMTNPQDPEVKQQQFLAFLDLNVDPEYLKEYNEKPFEEMADSFMNSLPPDFSFRSGFNEPRKMWKPLGISLLIETYLRISLRLDLLNLNRKMNVKPTIEFPEGSETPKCELVKYGSSTLLCGALFNHSCDPNIYWCIVENKFVAVVRLPIKAGEQLFVCYRHLYYNEPLVVRRKVLLQDCRFFCECNACINDNKFSAHRIVDTNSEIVRVAAQLNPSESIKNFKKNCEYIQNNFKNHPCQETIMANVQNKILLDRISDFGSFKGSLKLSAKK